MTSETLRTTTTPRDNYNASYSYEEYEERCCEPVARIFSEADGYHVCSDELNFLDARGPSYPTKAAAYRAASAAGYSHAVGSGTYHSGTCRIPSAYCEGVAS